MPRQRIVAALALMLALGCAASARAGTGVGAGGDAPALPEGVTTVLDLRGAFRAAYCARLVHEAADCTSTLRRFAGEPAAEQPVQADPSRYRLVFVPGFLARCFPGIHSFADMIAAARAAGYATELVEIGSRSGIDANARQLAAAVDGLPDDGRALVFVGHSKGPVDVLEMLVRRPDIAGRTRAVLSMSGALEGSPLADELRGVYAATLESFPFSGCERADGDPLADLAPATRRAWWQAHAAAARLPVYELLALPDLATLSPALLMTHARLARLRGANDGMVALRDQVAPGGALLGVVDADHFRIAIPFPGAGYVFLINAEPFPRAAMLLAALDVIAAQRAFPAAGSALSSAR